MGSLAAASLAVRILEVRHADAAAIVCGETVLSGLAPGSTARISVLVVCAEVNPQAHYVAFAHLDLDGDGQISPGDWLTAQSYPVLTHGYSNHCQLQLQPVSG